MKNTTKRKYHTKFSLILLTSTIVIVLVLMINLVLLNQAMRHSADVLQSQLDVTATACSLDEARDQYTLHIKFVELDSQMPLPNTQIQFPIKLPQCDGNDWLTTGTARTNSVGEISISNFDMQTTEIQLLDDNCVPQEHKVSFSSDELENCRQVSNGMCNRHITVEVQCIDLQNQEN